MCAVQTGFHQTFYIGAHLCDLLWVIRPLFCSDSNLVGWAFGPCFSETSSVMGGEVVGFCKRTLGAMGQFICE